MRKRSLKVQDLELERSRVSYGGVHNFEGFTKSPTAAEKAKLFRGSPSVSHVFGFSTASFSLAMATLFVPTVKILQQLLQEYLL